MSDIHSTQSLETQIAVIQTNTENIQLTITEIKSKLDYQYVTKDQHALLINRVSMVEKLTYGAVSVILLAFLSTVVYFFIPRT